MAERQRRANVLIGTPGMMSDRSSGRGVGIWHFWVVVVRGRGTAGGWDGAEKQMPADDSKNWYGAEAGREADPVGAYT